MADATIVAASLNDEELRKSINKLVNHLDDQLHYMVASTKVNVKSINDTLKTIGDVNLNFGGKGSKSGGTSKQVKAQEELAESVDKTTSKIKKQGEVSEMTFDQQSSAIQKATQASAQSASKATIQEQAKSQVIKEEVATLEQLNQKYAALAIQSARRFDVSPIQTMRMRQHELEAGIRVAATEAARAKKDVDELNAAIEAYRRTMASLPKDANGFAQRQQIQKEINEMTVLRDVAAAEQQKWVVEGRKLSAQYENTKAQIRGIGQEMIDVENKQQQAAQSAQRYTEEIRKQAEEIRKSKEWQEKGYVTVNGRDVYNFEGSDTPLKNRVTLEEQLLRLQELEKSTSKEITEEGAKRLTQEQLELAITGSTKETLQKSRDILRAMVETRQATTTFTAQLESANRLNEKLKELRTRYNEMTYEQRMSAEGQEIAKNIRIITRETQKLQSQLSRPANFKEALGLPEKTLDDMVYKMRQLQSYKLGVNITDQKGLDRLKEVDQQIARLKKQYDDLMVKNMQVIQSNTALGRSWNYMKNRLAFYFTVGASTAFIRSLIDVRGQYELLERSIGILIDSAQNGSQIFAELNAMAIKSPFTTMELGAAAKQLVAYDVAAKDVVETTKRLADMAAAVGIPIERLTYALGQIKAYGYLNARDARMFANAGIPLVKELADRYTELEGRLVSTADVYDRIKKKAISYEDVMDTVNKMTDEGGKFFNFQEKAADTLKVKIANLTLAWNNMLNEMGKDNQSIIGGGLNATKQIFEHWRDINNMMLSVVSTIGLLKTAQTAYLLLTSKVVDKTRALTIMQTVLGQKVALNLAGLGASFMKFVSNPANLAAAAIAGLVAWLGKAAYDYYDLVKANEEFNESIVTNAEENIKSIDKFFKDYYDQLSTVGSLNSADQTKLWERIQEEIEKTTKNAEEYVRVLEKIENISERISAGEAVLEQSKRIQEELKRLAERETFDIGGGFADDTLAENLQETSKYANALIKQYGSLEEAEKKLGLSSYGNDWKDYKAAIAEAEGELESVTQKLDKVNIAEVLGSGDVETQLANVRAFAHAWRDAFLATEKGSKIGIEGQTLLNNKLDEWITKQAVANGLIKDREINNLRVDAQAIVNIEKNRTAWEEFFRYLNNEERKRLDVAIKTNQLESDSIQKIWDDVAKRMKESSTTSYNLIQEQIANLRETPAIFIDIIYREKKENLDAQQKAFEDRYITPQSPFLLDPDKYLKEEKANREKYGRFIKKQGEDNVEWEKRLGQEYQNNEKSIKSLTDQIAKSANMSDVDKKAKQGELDTLTAQQKVLKEIEKDQGFNYDQFKKGKKGGSKKDILGDALAKEVQIIGEIQKRYKEYQQMGVNAQEAVTLATEEYGNTLRRTNATLAKYGISTKTSDELAGMDIREVRDYYKALLEGAKNKDNAKGIEAIEKALAGINVEITKLDYKKITDGLNNELGKLKDEYELAVELDADPEMGNLFAEMWGINLETLPRTAKEYAQGLTKELNKYLASTKSGVEIPNLLNVTKDDMRAFEQMVKDKKLNQTVYDTIAKNVTAARDAYTKETKEISKQWNTLIERYGGLQAKILKIYKDSVKEQGDIIKKFGSSEEIKQALDLIGQINISQDPEEITRLQTELAKVMGEVTKRNPIAVKTYEATQKEQRSKTSKAYWEDFKESDLYAMTFEDVAKLSNRAIDTMISKLEELKDKVKESPKDMEALIKAKNELEKEKINRNPFQGIIDGLKQWREANQRVKASRQALLDANKEVEAAEKNVKSNQGSGLQARAYAQERLTNAKKEQQQATEQLTKDENDQRNAQEKTMDSAKELSNKMQAMGEIANKTAEIFRLFGDNDTADMLAEIGNAFTSLVPTIIAVAVAIKTLESTSVILLAISAAAAVLIGVISFFSGRENKKITEAVEESERAVKKLENRVESLKGTYDAMTDSAEHSYGAQSAAATLAASSIKEQEIALKRLMLSETKRQLRLEQSRDSKNRDDDKILSLQKDIISQQNEIDSMLRETSRAVDEVVDSLLGISRGSWAEELTDALISAFKAGEDYMDVFEDSWEEMVQNMVVKTIAARVIGDALEKNVLSRIEQIENEETEPYRQQQAELAQHKANLQNLRLENENEWLATISQYPEFPELLSKLGEDAISYFTDVDKIANRMFAQMVGKRDPFLEKYGDQLEQELFKIYDNENARIEGTLKDAQQNAQIRALQEVMTEDTKNAMMEDLRQVFPQIMETRGVKFGQDAEKELSALQRGIQGITEQQAGALEGYMNGVSQQVYLQSNILQQINIAVQSFNFDAQLGTISQILLQLQTTYQNQQAIRSIMEGWTNASGMAVRVEMV